MLIVLLAFVWAPITSHCTLEAVPGLEFLQCASSVEHPAEQAGHCGDGCCAVEASAYLPASLEVDIPVALVESTLLAVPIVLQHPIVDEARLGVLTAGPPDLPRTWQFRSRTALPPRAPCFGC